MGTSSKPTSARLARGHDWSCGLCVQADTAPALVLAAVSVACVPGPTAGVAAVEAGADGPAAAALSVGASDEGAAATAGVICG